MGGVLSGGAGVSGVLTAPGSGRRMQPGGAPTAPGAGDKDWRSPSDFGSGAGAGGGAGSSSTRGYGAESRPVATVALALLTAASAAGLFRVFVGRQWIGPVFATIAAVHFAAWALRRGRVSPWAAAPALAAVIVLMASWTVLGRYTWDGLPTTTTWHHGVSTLQGLGNEIASMVAPVRANPTFTLVALLGAAVAAALADWAAFRWRAPMVALAPGLSAFILCCASGVGKGRGIVVGVEVAAACLFLMIERQSGDAGLVWFAGVRRGVGPWVAVAGGIIMAASVVAAVSVSPVLARRDGTGLMGWRSGPGGAAGERIVPNPLVDLRARLTEEADRPVFAVNSTVPSYWRLTSLDTFDGTTWTSTGSYGGFGTRLPGVPPPGTAVRSVRAKFQIQSLDSVWLPAQFDPVSVTGVRHVSYDPQSNSLLTSKSTANGLDYSVTSYQYLDTVTASGLEAAPGISHNNVVEQNLELPAGLSDRVVVLAQTIVAGHHSEYDRAIALQQYLRGPQFRYSLDPPSDGSGTEALASFLFETRTGYCQQFAGAYAVLARAVGLPTRLAVGFAQGQPTGSGFQVHDGDYHTWPEVYFGPSFGWVPFEPTPGFSVPGASGYSDTGGTVPGSVTSPATTVPSFVPPGGSSAPSTIARQHAKASSTTLPGTFSLHRGGGISPWWLTLPGVALMWMAITAGVPVWLRRASDRQAARSGTPAVVLNIWDRLSRELEWHGLARRPDETDDEFARRASLGLRRLGPDGQWSDGEWSDGEWAGGGLGRLAAMARQARFAPEVPPSLGGQADAAAREVQDRLNALTSRGRRVARLWLLPPGTIRRVFDLVGPESRRTIGQDGPGRAHPA